MIEIHDFSHKCQISTDEGKRDTKTVTLEFVLDGATEDDVQAIFRKQAVILWQQQNRKRTGKLQDGATIQVQVETLVGRRASNAKLAAESEMNSMSEEAIQEYMDRRFPANTGS